MTVSKYEVSLSPQAPQKRGAVILMILTISSLSSTALGYHYTTDVRGWWPLILCFEGALNLAYTAAYLGIVKFTRHRTMTSAACHAVTILLAQQTHALLFYTLQPDLLPSDQGLVALTPFHHLIHSGLSYYGIYAVSLLVACMQAIAARREQ